MSDKALPVWAEVDKKRFDNRKNKIQDTRNNNLQARPSRKVINLVESNKLLQDIVHSKITHEETLKKQLKSMILLIQLLIKRVLT